MAVSNEIFIQSPDRRRHERVDDEIVMFWRPVEADEIPGEQPTEQPSAGNFSLSAEIKRLNLASAELLKQIRQGDPQLAEYLTVLEHKVEALTSAVILKDSFTECHSTHHVNLSVSGLAFLAEQVYPLGTYLELKMVFSPSLTSIVAYGRVIYCIHYDDDKPLSHRIGVGFVRLDDYDRDKLSGHLITRQSKRSELCEEALSSN